MNNGIINPIASKKCFLGFAQLGIAFPEIGRILAIKSAILLYPPSSPEFVNQKYSAQIEII